MRFSSRRKGLYIEINGLKIKYEVSGDGSDVVLLHGWGTNIKTYTAITEQLSRSFRTTILDLPGFGQSQAPDSVWGTAEYAMFIREFLDALSISNPVLIGHSFGGRIIIYLTGRLKYNANKIVLIDSAGIKPKRSASYYYKVYSFKLLKKMARLFLPAEKAGQIIEKARNRHGSTDYKNAPGIMRNIMVKCVNEDLRHYLNEIKAPSLLIWGENDTDTPVSDGRLMEKLIPDAGLVVLKNAGHYSFLDKMYEFNIIVNHFLGEG